MPDLAVCISHCTTNPQTGKLAVGWQAADADGNEQNGVVDLDFGLTAIQVNSIVVNAAKAQLAVTNGVVFGPTDKATLFGAASVINLS